jgi:hypothetical protein
MSDGKLSRTVGKVFGRLTVIERLKSLRKDRYLYLCRCECGKEVTIHHLHGKDGTRSCGCLRNELVRARRTTHGMADSTENITWQHMRQRCNNPHNHAYADYGGRGIKVCPEWDASFEAFYRDMGPRPSPDHTLDRIDNERGYSPDNCRWATWKEQQNNRRGNRYLEFHGETKTCAEWSKEAGISPATLCKRLKRGWPVEKALIQAVRLCKSGVRR